MPLGRSRHIPTGPRISGASSRTATGGTGGERQDVPSTPSPPIAPGGTDGSPSPDALQLFHHSENSAPTESPSVVNSRIEGRTPNHTRRAPKANNRGTTTATMTARRELDSDRWHHAAGPCPPWWPPRHGSRRFVHRTAQPCGCCPSVAVATNHLPPNAGTDSVVCGHDGSAVGG